MKTTTTKLLTVLGALALGMAHWAPAASAQNHVVAIGQVDSAGNHVNSANTVGGVVSSVQNGTGDYTVTVTAAGAFAGTNVEDFIPAITCLDGNSDDQIPKANVSSVTANVLTIDVHTDDVEHTGNPNGPEPINNAFFFSVHRVPGSFAGPGSTKHLLSTGQVNTDGTLLSGLSLEGLAVSSTNPGAGIYEITFTNPGAFAGMVEDDFVPILSLWETGNFDEAIRGDITSVNANSITLRVRTDDVQSFIGGLDQDSATPTNNRFHFTLYQIPSDSGAAKSQALVSLGRVTSAGVLESGGTFGGSTTAAQNGTGEYTVSITVPGAFAGRAEDEFAAQLTLRNTISADESIGASLEVANANTLLLHVFISDVESGGTNAGSAANAPFYFAVYDAVAAYRPDLQISKKRSLTKHKGDGIYNNSGVGQTIQVKLRDRKNGKPRKKKYFFVAENDGNAVDELRLRTRSSGPDLKHKVFKITGGRENVTAAIHTGILTLDDLRPGEQVQFRAVAKFKKNANKKRRNMATRTNSLRDAAKTDAVKAKIRRITR